MQSTAIVDIVMAAVLIVVLVRRIADQSEDRSERILSLCFVMMIITLIIDAMAYTMVGPAYPVAFRYILNLICFTMGGFYILVFSYYNEELFGREIKRNRVCFRILRIFIVIWILLIAYEFIVSQSLITYQNGIENTDYTVPAYLTVIQVLVIVYLLVMAIINKKKVGGLIVALLCAFSIAPIIGTLAYTVLKHDFTYAIGAIALILVAEFVQRQQLQDALKAANKEAQRNESLYEMIGGGKWEYDITADDEVIVAHYSDGSMKNARLELSEVTGEGMNWVNFLHPDDRQQAYDAFMAAVHDHSGNTPYEVSFRVRDMFGEYHWNKSAGRTIRFEDGSGQIFGMNLDITEQMEEQQRRVSERDELERLRANEQDLKHSEFRALALAYLSEHEGDVTSYLNFFAERLRELVNCDQVIYRDENGHRFINNDPKLGSEYEIAAETCKNCPHSDMHSPLYAEGVTEMDDTAIGVDGVPVHKDCPVKSALTRTVQLDGDVCGYLAIHYIVGYHKFTDLERRTLEEFANLLSLSLSRQAAREENAALSKELELKKQVEEQKVKLEEQQKQLEEAFAMVDSANKAKTDFLFNMSHDIRTPMNAIIGFTNLTKKEIGNTEKALENLEKVQLSSNILLSLINDVLDMSRIESGKAELHDEKHEVVNVFDTIEPAMNNLAVSKGVDLSFTVGEIRDGHVFADGARFDRVLINIVSNAIKYTPSGGFVRVSADQIEDTKPGYGNYRFIVADSGIGMSEEFQQHMFEDFTREENSKTMGIQGTGLGLSLAKKLVDMMGGTISCVSTQGVGTTFTMVFPFRLQTEEDIAEEAVVHEVADVDLKGRTALLVEDNELNREIACEILADEGITVETAVNGQEAVATVRERGDGYYDFILMDIQMPVMDGYEATRNIHRLMPELKTPIIALSANAFAEDKKKSIEAGMDDHVAKPIDVGELVSVLGRFL